MQWPHWRPAHIGTRYDEAAESVKDVFVKGISTIQHQYGTTSISLAKITTEYLPLGIDQTTGENILFKRIIMDIKDNRYFDPGGGGGGDPCASSFTSSPKGTAKISAIPPQCPNVSAILLSGKSLTHSNFGVFGKSYLEIGEGSTIYGNVGTHSDSIIIKSNTYIYGDVVLLPNMSKPHKIIGDISSVKGKVIDVSNEIWLPSLKIPSNVSIKDKYAGEPLQPGEYAFKELDIKENKIITTRGNGAVTIYVTERLNISGYGNLQVGNANITIFGTQSLKNVSISGSKQISCTIYAPDAEILVSGDVVIKGSIIGNKVIYRSY